MSAELQEQSEGQILLVSEGFRGWLFENRCSLAFTTYERGRVALVGLRDDGSMWAQERFVDHCQGLSADGDELIVSTPYMLWRFKNILPEGTSFKDNGADRLFFPRLSYITGALDIHDIVPGRDGNPIFVNTLYSCLARPDATRSFEPVWQPSFVTALAPDDRCHLNGLAMENGAPAFATALAQSDTARGWKTSGATSGVVISVTDNEIIADGLSMPNSPRFHNGELWLLNAGTGEFGRIDRTSGKFDAACFCPGYARGLSFINQYAVIGLSKPRNGASYDGLALETALDGHDDGPQCGLVIVNLETGEIEHWLRFTDLVNEICAVAIFGGVRQPSMVGFQDDTKLRGFIDFEGV